MTTDQLQAMIQRVAKKSTADPIRWREFLDEVYSHPIRNPDAGKPRQKDTITAETLLKKDPVFAAAAHKEYERWLEKKENHIEVPDQDEEETPDEEASKSDEPAENEWDEDQPTHGGAPKSKEHPPKSKETETAESDDEMTQEEADKSHAEAEAKANSVGLTTEGQDHSKSRAEHKRLHDDLDKKVADDQMTPEEARESAKKLHEKVRALGYSGMGEEGEFEANLSRRKHKHLHDDLDQEAKGRPPKPKHTVYQPPSRTSPDLAPEKKPDSAAPEHPKAESDPEAAKSEAAAGVAKAKKSKPADTTKKEDAEADAHLSETEKKHKDSWMDIKERAKGVDEQSNITHVILGENAPHRIEDDRDDDHERSLSFTDAEGNDHDLSPQDQEHGLDHVTKAHGFRDAETDLIKAHVPPDSERGSTEDRVAAMLAHLKSLKTKEADRAAARLGRMDVHKADAFIDGLHGRQPKTAMFHRVALRFMSSPHVR